MTRDSTRDIVRGLTSLEMTFVNISKLPGTAHSGFVGQITYSDTIFPCFAFLAGMSPASVRHNVGLAIIGLGLQIPATFETGKQLRILGVLQRLGLASIIAKEPCFGFLQRYGGLPLIVLWYAITLFGSTSVIPLANPDFPGADQEKTSQTRIDRILFGQRLYRASNDPEGLLGSLTTAVSMIAGRYFVDQQLSNSERLLRAVGMITLGEAMHFLFPMYAPISKSLWTPSFVLVTSGTSILKYLAAEALAPLLPRTVHSLLEEVGRRSLEVFIVSNILTLVLKWGGEQSMFSKLTSWFGNTVGRLGSIYVMSMSVTAIVAASARLMISFNVRLRW